MLRKSPKLGQQPKFDWAIYGWANFFHIMAGPKFGWANHGCWPSFGWAKFQLFRLKIILLGSNTDFSFFGQFHVPKNQKHSKEFRSCNPLFRHILIYL